MTEQEVLLRICRMSDALGFFITENAPRIARIKARQEDWRQCPCAKNDKEMYCGSRKCEEMTKKDGHCHCNLFKIIKKTEEKQ